MDRVRAAAVCLATTAIVTTCIVAARPQEGSTTPVAVLALSDLSRVTRLDVHASLSASSSGSTAPLADRQAAAAAPRSESPRPVSPDGVAQAFVEARLAGNLAKCLEYLDPDLQKKLQQMLKDVGAGDKASDFSQNLALLGESEPLMPLLAMLFGPQATLERTAVTTLVIGRIDPTPDSAIVLVQQQRLLFGKPVDVVTLSALSLKRRDTHWYVAAPGGDDDLPALYKMLSQGFLAGRDGRTVDTASVSSPSAGTLQVVTLTPAAGSIVSRETVITAELQYSIEQFEPGRFLAMALFVSTQSGTLTMGRGPDVEQPALERASGRVKLTYPLRIVWEDPDVKKPFEVTFCVNQLVGRSGASTAVACAPKVTYQPRTSSLP